MARSSSELIHEEILEKMVQILKALANSGRLQIVNILLRNECRVGEIAKTLGTKQSLTSQQLSNMKYTGILKLRRDGNVVYYSLANDGIKRIVKSIITEI